MTPTEIFDKLGLSEVNSGVFAGEWLDASGDSVDVVNPTTGESISTVTLASLDDYEKVMDSATEAFERWRILPAPRRGVELR